MTDEDIALSFLPLSHAFERMVVYIYLYAGATVAFAESPETLARDMAKVRPTLMTAVPRVFEKLDARIHETAAHAPAIRQAIFGWAVGVGQRRSAAVRNGRPVGALLALQDRLADTLMFHKIREATGGRLRVLVSGSAPLPRTMAEFFDAIGLTIPRSRERGRGKSRRAYYAPRTGSSGGFDVEPFGLSLGNDRRGDGQQAVPILGLGLRHLDRLGEVHRAKHPAGHKLTLVDLAFIS